MEGHVRDATAKAIQALVQSLRTKLVACPLVVKIPGNDVMGSTSPTS